MTIPNVRSARAIWLVDWRDLNPGGIDILPILAGIKDRYRFQVVPQTIEDADENNPKGIVFGQGSFAFEGNHYTVVKATMHGDGLVVDSGLSTDFCEAFLADFLAFLSNKFGLTFHPKMLHKKLYLSEVIVKTDKDLNGLFASLASIREKLNLLTGQDFQAAGFAFSTDPAVTTRPTQFKFEREVGKEFDQRRYYSSAPLRTSQHVELLQEMESYL